MEVAIVGASGYAGAELLRICATHDTFKLTHAAAQNYAGTLIKDLYPHLGYFYGDKKFSDSNIENLDGLDIVFLALPHGASQNIVPSLSGKVGKIIDLSADFRLKDPQVYKQWYGQDHSCIDFLPKFTYGLPELNRQSIKKADLVAVAGCYPTAAVLSLNPLVKENLIEPKGIIVDAASGISGAGRSLTHSSHFSTANEDFSAYNLLHHRHTPEMEQAIGSQVLFTPHLAPMTRGILATCYAKPQKSTSTEQLIEVLTNYYKDDPFVIVDKKLPSTKAVSGSNFAHITARFDPRTGWIVVICAIDNLVKGAAGQAIQCANLACGINEQSGLLVAGPYP